ncbi:sodium-dependent phosphate transporter 1 [Eurytemora carolleeae]|uniref:sodium-dependent phosphate transporter 1 n=1 Tax=Eurytemora carolleeae TaxID=1294199 RepID=UPI000C78FA3F|nr:sodium-dependent phosphate transporter 1 [Eurytemora carolleeae]|eukprot:XP_023329618.1 sodium-dependent phosphate transporter 1-like [Eurytemora affinis]
MVASFFSWPVAGTHCIIFGLLGFTVTAKGTDGIKNTQAFIQIVYMLFVSIIVSMVATALVYYPLYKYCIRTGSPFSGINKIVYSIITGLSVGIPVCFIILQSNKAFDIFSKIWPSTDQDTWIVIGIGLGVSFLVTLLAIFVTLPYLKNCKGDFKLDADIRFWTKKKTELLEADKMKMKEEMNGNLCPEAGDTKEEEEEEKEEGDSPEIKRIFRPLQIISAMTSALVHGGNDVANCIGPFVVIYLVFQEGVIDEISYSSPFLISLWGGIGISLGLIFYGKKVIITMGSGISSMTPSRGYCVEWVASLVGLIFTATGLMISTTQCKVGGLIGAGLAQGLVETGSPREALKYVNFKVLSGVLFSWILTIPVAFGLSSVIFLLLKYVLL